MLVTVGDARTSSINLVLAGLLSTVAGALNSVGFLIAGTFTANMTGNISAFADTLADGAVGLALPFAGLVIAFVSGAALAALAIQTGERHKLRQVYALAIVSEAIILLAMAGALALLPHRVEEPLLVVALSFVMGLQNAVTTMISKAKVRTTHVSGMATDMGIEIASLLGDAAQRKGSLPKLGLHSLTLLCFTCGGIGGAILLGVVGLYVFVIAALILLLIGIPEAFRASSHKT